MRVAVLCGGRSSEHDVSLRSGEAVARGLEEAGHEALRVTISREGAWSCDGAAVALTPGRRPARRRRRLPGPARPLRRGRQRPGPARVARPALRRLRRALLGDLHGQADAEAALRRGGDPAGRVRRGRRGGLARALRGDGLAALGEALAARLQRRDQPGRGAGERARRGGRAGPAPRPAGDRRGLRRGPRGRVLAARQRGGRGLAAGRDRRPRRLVRLRDQVPRRRHGAGRPGPDRRDEQPTRVRELAVSAFQLGGCAGLARCDFFVEPDGAVLVNEINTMPGFTETSVYAKLWEASGLAYPTSATAWSPSRSSATPRRAPTSSEPGSPRQPAWRRSACRSR